MANQREQAYQSIVDRAIERLGKHLVVGLPLGLGKPNRLVNAFYQRARDDSSIRLEIVTALSLDIPQPRHWLEQRMMGPIIERLFGRDYPRLDYVVDLLADDLPDNVTVTEFYFQSGAAMGKPQMQRHYVSSNYTHVARDLVDRGINVCMQFVAGPVDGRYSLSCNPDVTLDLVGLVREQADHPFMTVAQVHPDLPFMHGDAVVEADFFDEVVDADPEQILFALPRAPVSLQDHAVGFHASRLMADDGTLQIGIGSLSDALVHSMILRHRHNDHYRKILERLGVSPWKHEESGVFEKGIYGASEMFMDAFMHLYQAGILRREVFDDLEVQQRVNRGERVEQAGRGAIMDGGFFLGTRVFYDFLNELDDQERPRFRMHGVGRINQLYGGSEALEIAQRRHARFINTCMMVTATGAAVSDGLADHQVVSGVGGQYNFVAMAHAMADGRSALMLRSTREGSDGVTSNVVWEYPHTTIPRHLRDLVVTEYGIAELRGRTDEECIQALVGIMDARFQDELVKRAKRAGKLASDWQVPEAARRNTPEHLEAVFGDFSEDFPDYPYGSDFTEIEQKLIPALKKLKSVAESKPALIRALLRGRPGDHREALERLKLDKPESLKDRLYARLVAAVLDD
jgi:acyl-CoA hydrolase